MPLRFTVRRMMIFVAVTAILAWTARLVHLSYYYEQRANYYAAQWHWPQTSTARETKWRMWARDLIPKYRHAARYPWLSVVPDPPEPK
jgi:hypothetical protein